jgi:hypothetical protein
VAIDQALVSHNNHTEKQSQETHELSRGSAKYNTCLLPRCGVPMDEGCTQPLSSDPMINLNTTVFFFLILSPVCEESPQLGASRPYNWWSQRSTEVREGRATHTRLKTRAQSRTQATTWAQNTTQGVLYSIGAQVTISKNRMRENGVLVLRNDQRKLGLLLHVPRGPFYSPKAARSRWRQSWKANLAFCWVAHRIVRCATRQPLFMSGAWFPSKSGATDRCRLVAVGAPDTVRCTVPPADCWSEPRVARGFGGRPLRWRPLAHRTVRCTTGQSGEL